LTFLDHALAERITAEARRHDARRTVLTAVAAALYGIGWTAFKALAGLWFIAAWVGAAVKVGWQEARATDRT
jgi:hypothetical protein